MIVRLPSEFIVTMKVLVIIYYAMPFYCKLYTARKHHITNKKRGGNNTWIKWNIFCQCFILYFFLLKSTTHGEDLSDRSIWNITTFDLALLGDYFGGDPHNAALI